MTTKHTTGPWHIEVTHVTEGAYTISHGTNRHGDGPEGDVGKFYCSKDDIALVVSAPELLDALEQQLSFIRVLSGTVPLSEKDTHRRIGIQDDFIRAVIAKATGA